VSNSLLQGKVTNFNRWFMDIFGTSTIIFFINDRDYLSTHTQLFTLKDPNHIDQELKILH